MVVTAILIYLMNFKMVAATRNVFGCIKTRSVEKTTTFKQPFESFTYLRKTPLLYPTVAAKLLIFEICPP